MNINQAKYIYSKQSGAVLSEYVLILALVIIIFVTANQIIVSAVQERTRIRDESHSSMTGCVPAVDGGHLTTFGQACL